MKLFGLELMSSKRFVKMLNIAQTYAAGMAGWFGVIREGNTGWWQQNITIDGTREVLSFSGVFACVTGIANDISKLRVKLMALGENGIGSEVDSTSAHFKVLKKPNHYQNRIQFWALWIISKLLYGNTYILKVRDRRSVVTELYILDPQRVKVLIAETGDVYYQVSRDVLSGLYELITVPASEVIHDLMNPLWHPLCGVSPIYACAMSATMGNRIQKDSTKFFTNMSRPSGALTAPGTITEETAKRMKAEWEENFGGENIGRLAVLGDGLKYEAMTIPANDAQLIEQLKWTVEDVARAFHYPMFKLGGTVPQGVSISALNQAYYSDCLQNLLESAELCLDEGLSLPSDRYTEFDLDGLLRMDAATRYETKGKAVKDGWMKPDEARRGEDLEPVPGGNACYLQQQNYSLAALAKRDAKEDPFAAAPKSPVDENLKPNDPNAAALLHLSNRIVKGLEVLQ